MKTLLIVTLAAALGGCATSDSGAKKPDPVRERGGYLEKGPTVMLDSTAAETGPTTLKLLEDRVKENAQLKAQVEELEKAAKSSETRANDSEKAFASQRVTADQLQSMLEHAVAEQKALTSEVLKAKIARVKVEQDMLRMKLAELVKDAP